jgi:type IV pilus assembly protein PilA
MTRHDGFTWIELVLVLGIVAIIGAMAIPGLQDTALRKQVKEGLDLADVARKGVQSVWATTGKMPDDNEEAGVPAKDKLVSSMVKSVEVDKGAVTITFGNNASKALYNLRVTQRPAVVKGELAVPIAWICHKVPVPDKMEIRGNDRTDIPPKWLPVECRGAAKP